MVIFSLNYFIQLSFMKRTQEGTTCRWLCVLVMCEDFEQQFSTVDTLIMIELGGTVLFKSITRSPFCLSIPVNRKRSRSSHSLFILPHPTLSAAYSLIL